VVEFGDVVRGRTHSPSCFWYCSVVYWILCFLRRVLKVGEMTQVLGYVAPDSRSASIVSGFGLRMWLSSVEEIE